MTHISVVLADDHPAVPVGIRGALARTSDIEMIGYADQGDEALNLIQTLRPDVALRDCRLPDLDGPAVAQAATKRVCLPGCWH